MQVSRAGIDCELLIDSWFLARSSLFAEQCLCQGTEAFLILLMRVLAALADSTCWEPSHPITPPTAGHFSILSSSFPGHFSILSALQRHLRGMQAEVQEPHPKPQTPLFEPEAPARTQLPQEGAELAGIKHGSILLRQSPQAQAVNQ